MTLKIQTYLPLLLALTLVACSDDDSNGPITKDVVVVATRAPDYSSGAISLVDVEAFTAQNNLTGTISDISVRSGSGKDHYFVIEKYDTDRIKRYNIGSTGPVLAPGYPYSTQDAGDTESSNPYDLIIASPTKAYLLRYGSGKLWVVNPSATTEANFKTGEIDLSAYDADGVPEMSAAVIKGDRLYVALQRLEFFSATRNGYVAVIDTTTNQEIDTKPGVEGLKGIELPVRNPEALVVSPNGTHILAIAGGGYDDDFAPVYDGGIARIDTSNNTATLLLDDGNVETHPYGQFGDLVLASAERGYFIGSAGFFAGQTLYRFNPSNGSTAPVAVTGFNGVKLGALAIDPTGRLWVGRNETATPGLSVLDISGSSESIVKALVSTTLIPLNIDFVDVPLTSQ